MKKRRRCLGAKPPGLIQFEIRTKARLYSVYHQEDGAISGAHHGNPANRSIHPHLRSWPLKLIVWTAIPPETSYMGKS